jgi:DNA-binding PadR family transcriptional regulator
VNASDDLTAPAEAAPTERRRPNRAGRGGSLLELAVLGLLGDGELHGYELKKQLDDVLPAGSSVSFGSLYPTLGRLERTGDVTVVGESGTTVTTDPDLPPMTGALSGELAAFTSRLRDRSNRPGRTRRGRKEYAVTAAGRTRLVELLTTLDPADDRTFALQVAFSRHLERTQRLAVLGRRRAELTNRLNLTQRADQPITDRWRQSLRGHAVTTITTELAWVDGLIAGEQANDNVDQTVTAALPSVPTTTPATATPAAHYGGSA